MRRDSQRRDADFAYNVLDNKNDSRFAAGEYAKHGIDPRGNEMFMNHYLPRH
jgi:hypothetical protein